MTLIQHLDGYVFEVKNFLSSEDCDHLVNEIEEVGFEPALINLKSGAVSRPNIRNNDRLVRDDPEAAAKFWPKINPFLPQVFRQRRLVGLNERFRFYRYDVGQKFDRHQDGYFEKENGERSLFTFMIYLNDDFKGGGTSFVDTYSAKSFAEFCVQPKKGSALLFYHKIMHQGDPVIEGRKYAMRTDVMYSAATG